MKISKSILGAGIVLMFASQPATAQSVHNWNNAGSSETRATASVTIPLGGKRKAENAEPRLDFAVQSYQIGQERASHLKIDPVNNNRILQRQSVVSFTLDRRPKLMLNGKKLATFGPVLHADDESEQPGNSDGGNTALYVLGGLGAAVLGLAVATSADAVDAVNDLTDPD